MNNWLILCDQALTFGQTEQYCGVDSTAWYWSYSTINLTIKGEGGGQLHLLQLCKLFVILDHNSNDKSWQGVCRWNTFFKHLNCRFQKYQYWFQKLPSAFAKVATALFLSRCKSQAERSGVISFSFRNTMADISNQLSARALSYHSRVKMQKCILKFNFLQSWRKGFSVYDLCLHSMYCWQQAFYASEKMKKKVVEEAVLW